MKICINAGHGGKDSGAIGNGLLEKDLNLNIALEIGNVLSGYGIEVVQTRISDRFHELHEIAEIANRSEADFFLSVHLNSATNNKARGMETYYHASSDTGKLFAKDIQDHVMRQGFFTADRGIKTAEFAVLRRTKMPAALAELGFISNIEDATLVKTKQLEIARAVAEGVMNHIGFKYGDQPTPPKEDPLSYNEGQTLFKKLTNFLKGQPTSPSAMDSSKKGIASGIFADGDGDGLVDNPQGFVTREQLAVILDRLGLLD